jgi:hypothetical protein
MEVVFSLLLFVGIVWGILWLIPRVNRYFNRVPGARPPEQVEADYRQAGIAVKDGNASGELGGVPFSITFHLYERPHALIEIPAPGTAEFKLPDAESHPLGYERVWQEKGKLRARRHLCVELPEVETLRTWLATLATLRR